MSKVSCLINKKLIKTILSSFSLVSVTKPSLKTSDFLTRSLNFSRIPTPRQNFLSNSFSHARASNLSFNRNPRSFCSISSPHRDIEVNQKILSSSLEANANEVSIPVRAYFMFNRIDLKGLTAENQANLILHTSGKNNYAVLKFSNATSETPSLDSEAKLRDSSYSYMVVFPYGSTVMFNMHDEEVDGYLEIIRRHASGLLETIKDGASFQNYHIKYEVRENSNLPMWMQGGQGYVMLQHLDIDVIHVISSVLGQSIALDYYVRKADGVIAAFTELPRARWTIRSNIMRKKRMNQLVGSANSTLAELIVKVGLFDRYVTFQLPALTNLYLEILLD